MHIFQSAEDENKMLKSVFGAIAGLVIGTLLFIVLVYSFDYTELQAGIIVAISTLIMCLGLAFSTLCRCIMALIFPNFFTGKGRTVFLSIIFGVLLSSPVANITYNAKETGKSFSCMTELARNQTLALQRQLAQPIEELIAYVEDQNSELKRLSHDINGAFNQGSDEINQGISTAQGSLNSIIQVIYRQYCFSLVLLQTFCNVFALSLFYVVCYSLLLNVTFYVLFINVSPWEKHSCFRSCVSHVLLMKWNMFKPVVALFLERLQISLKQFCIESCLPLGSGEKIFKDNVPASKTLRKHTYIILTHLNSTFIQ